jgi:hypothetical protein
LTSTEAITDLLTCAPDSDVVYPVVSQDDVQAYYPGRQASYVKTKEGLFTGSSCLIFRPSTALAKEKLLVDLLNARKSAQAMLALIGPWVAMKILLSTLSLGQFETYLSEAIGLDCRVFITHFPELLISIDSPDDIELVRSELAG